MVTAGPIYEEVLPFDLRKLKHGTYYYQRKAPGNGEEGRITELRFDLNRHTFMIKAQKVDLTGLEAPVYIDLVIGSFVGLAEVQEQVINGGKPLPIQFMSGVADVLRVTDVEIVPDTGQGFDTLKIKGRISLQSGVADLTALPVSFNWSGQSFMIPAGLFRKVGDKNIYRARSGSQPDRIVARFNWDRCIFRINIRKASITPKVGDVSFGLAFGSFNEVDEFNLP